LIASQSIEFFHILKEVFRDVRFEEGIDDVPEVEMILDLFSRNHSVVIRFDDVLILIVDKV
jgi:hypothetical protein